MVRITAHAAYDVDAARDVRESHGVREISDATARTVAMWWQSPGTVGSVLAALASGREVDVAELLDDIHAVRVQANSAHPLDESDSLALDMLATWALNR